MEVRLLDKWEMQGSIPREGDYPFVPFCLNRPISSVFTRKTEDQELGSDVCLYIES